MQNNKHFTAYVYHRQILRLRPHPRQSHLRPPHPPHHQTSPHHPHPTPRLLRLQIPATITISTARVLAITAASTSPLRMHTSDPRKQLR